MDDDQVMAESERREAAAKELHATLDACRTAGLTPDEILQIVRSVLEKGDILIEGTLFDHLRDGEAADIIRIMYGVLSPVAKLSFAVERRSRKNIHDFCEDAGIANSNVSITPEGDSLRVEIAKLQ